MHDKLQQLGTHQVRGTSAEGGHVRCRRGQGVRDQDCNSARHTCCYAQLQAPPSHSKEVLL